MFIDTVTLEIQAGNGGNGSSSFRRDAQTSKGGPDGGNGGEGGSIYFQGSSHINDLREFRYKKHIEGQSGIDGKGKKLFGKNAPDITILLPLGTVVTDIETQRTFEIRDTIKQFLVAKGGKGGRGNVEFATPTNRAPVYAEKGKPGEKKTLHLELKLIADVGLIGLPNAGKSSLLSVITHANPKIGNYPFTTVEPNIGMLDTYPIADIPGLIEGASKGRGLGITFLKHIEKTKLIVHCIDVTESDPLKAYTIVRAEFASYNKKLLEKQEIIVLNKSDLVNDQRIKELKKIFKSTSTSVFVCSIYNEKQIEQLKKAIVKHITAHNSKS